MARPRLETPTMKAIEDVKDDHDFTRTDEVVRYLLREVGYDV